MKKEKQVKAVHQEKALTPTYSILDKVDVQTTVSINESRIAEADSKTKERLDLSDQQRKQIWHEFISALKKAERKRPLDTSQPLRVGDIFLLSKETLLMPVLEPNDPIAVAEKIKGLPARTTIKILGFGVRQETVWYSVEATSPLKSSTATGWINSISLMRQGPLTDKKKTEEQAKIENWLNGYENRLAQKYGLSHEQLREIFSEGIAKDWAFQEPGQLIIIKSGVETNFFYAHEGDYWVIEDDNIAVLRERKVSANEAQLLRNLVTAISPGTKVEILEKKGILSPWIRVYVYNDRNQICASGWILAETVKNARRIKKGFFSP